MCDISESSITLRARPAPSGRRSRSTISSLGIKEITFYVDGHKLKKLTAAHAKKGQFVGHDRPAQVPLRRPQGVGQDRDEQRGLREVRALGRVRAGQAGRDHAEIHRLSGRALPAARRAASVARAAQGSPPRSLARGSRLIMPGTCPTMVQMDGDSRSCELEQLCGTVRGGLGRVDVARGACGRARRHRDACWPRWAPPRAPPGNASPCITRA